MQYHPQQFYPNTSRSKPAPGSGDIQAWGQWGAGYGESSPQYLEALGEIARIQQLHAVHRHPYSSAMDAHILSRPQPEEGSMDATAWGDWGAAHGKHSWQYTKSVQEVTRIRNARMISPAQLYRSLPPRFPSAPIPRHQFAGPKTFS